MKILPIIFVLLVITIAPWLCAGEDVILVGRSTMGQLKVDTSFPQPVVLPASIYPGISGYAFGDLGIHSTILDDTNNDFLQLSTAADFRFILLAKDAGMEVWNDTGSGYLGIGELFYIGPSPFDTHPVWNLPTGTPGTSYTLTLKLRDLNGVYPDSAPFALSFTAPPIPGLSINISRDDPAHVSISWPTNAIDWNLETATSVTGTNWETATNISIVSGTNFYSIFTASYSQQFFRLHKQ